MHELECARKVYSKKSKASSKSPFQKERVKMSSFLDHLFSWVHVLNLTVDAGDLRSWRGYTKDNVTSIRRRRIASDVNFLLKGSKVVSSYINQPLAVMISPNMKMAIVGKLAFKNCIR